MDNLPLVVCFTSVYLKNSSYFFLPLNRFCDSANAGLLLWMTMMSSKIWHCNVTPCSIFPTLSWLSQIQCTLHPASHGGRKGIWYSKKDPQNKCTSFQLASFSIFVTSILPQLWPGPHWTCVRYSPPRNYDHTILHLPYYTHEVRYVLCNESDWTSY